MDTLAIHSGARNFHLGAITQGLWDGIPPVAVGRSPGRRAGGEIFQKLKQFVDIIYRF